VIGWAFLGWLLQGKEPEWATASRTRPAMENTRDNIIAMLPENAEALIQRLRNRDAAPDAAEPAEPDPQRPAAPAAPAAPQPPQRRS
jgi:membrane protein required for colicin V production